MYKSTIKKLKSYMDRKHPEYRGKLYTNQKNKLIHVGMDKAIFEHNTFRLYLWDCEAFVKENLKEASFEFFRIPTLINCMK